MGAVGGFSRSLQRRVGHVFSQLHACIVFSYLRKSAYAVSGTKEFPDLALVVSAA